MACAITTFLHKYILITITKHWASNSTTNLTAQPSQHANIYCNK